MRPMPALSVLLVAAALAGCGGGGDDDNGGGSGGGSSNPPASSQPAETQSTETQSSEPSGDSSGGKDVFASAGCASCHTLAAAGAQGVTGPNLDDLQPSFDQVRNQVTNGGGGMPAFGDELSDSEIDLVAHYVADNAGR
jgi:mono/diheme cytochrome c family protein